VCVGGGELRRPRLFEWLRLHDLAAWTATAGEEDAEEAGLVGDGGIHTAGRGHAERERRRVELPAVVGPHRRRRQVLRQLRVLLETAPLQAERFEHLLVNV